MRLVTRSDSLSITRRKGAYFPVLAPWRMAKAHAAWPVRCKDRCCVVRACGCTFSGIGEMRRPRMAIPSDTIVYFIFQKADERRGQ